MLPTITIAAIAKNEGRYILEWVAYHFAIGVDRLIVFSNDSEDDQMPTLQQISQREDRLQVIDWPSPIGQSPQVAAYQEAAKLAKTHWIAFIDIDEFIVPVARENLKDYLSGIPDEISSIHINWRNFGSGGLTHPQYDLVTRAFMMGANTGWGNHHHFKSIARRSQISRVSIHNIETSSGNRVLSDLSSFETENDGLSDRIVHWPIRIHHYQCKTELEFSARMRRGDANFPPGHPDRFRNGGSDRFKELDLNEMYDDSIRRFDDIVDAELARLRSYLAT